MDIKSLFTVSLLLLTAGSYEAAINHIPEDRETVQVGINTADDGEKKYHPN